MFVNLLRNIKFHYRYLVIPNIICKKCLTYSSKFFTINTKRICFNIFLILFLVNLVILDFMITTVIIHTKLAQVFRMSVI